MSLTRTQVFLTEEQCNRIDRAAEEGITMAEVIRRAVDEYVTAEVDAASDRTTPRQASTSLLSRHPSCFPVTPPQTWPTNPFPRSVSIRWIEQPPNERGE